MMKRAKLLDQSLAGKCTCDIGLLPCQKHGWSGKPSSSFKTDIERRLKAVATMPELDAMRIEVVGAMKASPEAFERIQRAFIAAGDRLRRIPLKDRSW